MLGQLPCNRLPSEGTMARQHWWIVRSTLGDGFRITATCLTVMSGFSLSVHNIGAESIDIIFVARPQFASNSCRSYALALASGTLPNSPIPISTVQELRAAEED